MAYDAFIKLAGIEGEATAKGFEKAIDLQAFSWGATNPVSQTGGGLGAGKATLSSLNIMKKTDKSSAAIFAACCAGTHIKNCTVHLRKAGGNQVEFLTYTLGDVMIESVQWSGNSGGDDTPMESVSIAFSKIEVKYIPQDATGKAGSPVVGSWDLRAVTK